MSVQAVAGSAEQSELKASWVPMIAIALGQMIMSFNVASLPVALGGMVKSFGVPPTTIATGIVAYGMLVAGFVMPGAKLNQRYGAARVFRAAVVLFCISQILMTLSPTATVMIAAQALCGASASVIVPSLVALIAENYKGRQQATAVGALGSARAAAGVLAFVIGGILGTYIGWRPVLNLIAVSAIVFLELPAQGGRGAPGRQNRCGRRRARRSGDRAHQLRLQQPEWMGAPLATANAPFNLLWPVARSDFNHCRHRAWSGVSDVDA